MADTKRISESGSSPPRHHADDASSLSSADAQAGVKGIEAISSTWTKTSLIIAYVGIFALAFAISLEAQTTLNLTPYATSAFAAHSLLAAIYVVQGVVNAVIKPPMAKIANVFGRLEAYSISIVLYMLGYIQQAASNNVETFASAQIFYSAGFTGQLILQQIFIADTTDLRWRALLSSLPDVPYLVTVWCGPPIAQSLVGRDFTNGWRWGYGLWAIVLPVCFMPLAFSLALNLRRAHQRGIVPPRPWEGMSVVNALKHVWFELDVFGLLLLAAAISLLLVPLPLGNTAGWQNPSIIAMLVIGCVCLVVFPLWESSHKLAPKPFLSMRMLKNRTVTVGCLMGFFYFAVFYTSVFPYFSSYLQVVQYQDVTHAGYIVSTFNLASTAASIVVGLLIRYTKTYKWYMVGGACMYIVGIGIMMRYRVEGSNIGSIVGSQIALGIGGGFFNVPAQLGVQASVSHQDVAAATAIFLTVIEIGGAVGAAISGVAWTTNLSFKLTNYLPPDAQSQAALIAGNFTLAQQFVPGTPERVAINQAYQETMDILLIIAICLAAPIIPLGFLMKNYKLDNLDQPVKGVVIGDSKVGEESVQAPEVAAEERPRKVMGLFSRFTKKSGS